jgi:hypothetical protein
MRRSGLLGNATGDAGRTTGTGISGGGSPATGDLPASGLPRGSDSAPEAMQPLFPSAPRPAPAKGGQVAGRGVCRAGSAPRPSTGLRAGAEWPGSKIFPAVCMRGAPRPGSTGPNRSAHVVAALGDGGASGALHSRSARSLAHRPYDRRRRGASMILGRSRGAAVARLSHLYFVF